MAVSPLNPKHCRSISLPSTSHPLTDKVEEQIHRLRASESSLSSSSSSLCQYLGGLNDLYSCVNDLVQLQLTQQAMACREHKKWLDDLLDGSIRLVDICGTTRDVLSLMKQNVRDLQSALRRRAGAPDTTNAVSSYTSCRKKVSKEIRKCLTSLKKTENKSLFTLLDKNHDLVAMVTVFREVESITISMFESLLAFVSSQKTQPKPSGWSLASKLRRTKSTVCKGEHAGVSEVQKVDFALNAVIAHKSCNGFEGAQEVLETLDLSINDLEDGLEDIFRNLIKIRVSLLNTLNH